MQFSFTCDLAHKITKYKGNFTPRLRAALGYLFNRNDVSLPIKIPKWCSIREEIILGHWHVEQLNINVRPLSCNNEMGCIINYANSDSGEFDVELYKKNKLEKSKLRVGDKYNRKNPLPWLFDASFTYIDGDYNMITVNKQIGTIIHDFRVALSIICADSTSSGNSLIWRRGSGILLDIDPIEIVNNYKFDIKKKFDDIDELIDVEKNIISIIGKVLSMTDNLTTNEKEKNEISEFMRKLFLHQRVVNKFTVGILYNNVGWVYSYDVKINQDLDVYWTTEDPLLKSDKPLCIPGPPPSDVLHHKFRKESESKINILDKKLKEVRGTGKTIEIILNKNQK